MASTRSTRPAGKKALKRRGRPPGIKKSGVAMKETINPRSTKKAAPRKGATGDEAEDELSILSIDKTSSSTKRKRKVQNDDNTVAESQPRSRNTYKQLEVKSKRIPQEQLEAWPQVPPQVLEQVIAVIRDAKKDIANAQRDERRMIAAHNTLNPLVKKLSRQLGSSRIPPQAKDVHFNIDKLTERNTHISREVTTARHAKQLLTEQVNTAQDLLSKDEKSLEQLKRNTKKWRAEWKHQEKRGRIHPLLQAQESKNGESDGPDDINLKPSTPINLSLLETPDTELAPILVQLRRGLENVQGNHAQVKGIDEAMVHTRAALDTVLFQQASPRQYAAL